MDIQLETGPDLVTELFTTSHTVESRALSAFILTRRPNHTTFLHFGLRTTESRGLRMLIMSHLPLQTEADLYRGTKRLFTWNVLRRLINYYEHIYSPSDTILSLSFFSLSVKFHQKLYSHCLIAPSPEIQGDVNACYMGSQPQFHSFL